MERPLAGFCLCPNVCFKANINPVYLMDLIHNIYRGHNAVF